MRLYDIVAERQSKSGSLTSRFSGEERLENFIQDAGWDAGAIVHDGDFCPYIPRRGLESFRGNHDQRWWEAF